MVNGNCPLVFILEGDWLTVAMQELDPCGQFFGLVDL